LITAGVVDVAKRRDFIDVIARMFTSSRGTDSSRQNSEFLIWAAMYKNTAWPPVRRTVAAYRYAVNDVLTS
jgi:hypothetical protein